MRRLRLKIDDPDGFFKASKFYGYMDEEDDEYPDLFFTIKEGELPPRFPTFTYEEDKQ